MTQERKYQRIGFDQAAGRDKGVVFVGYGRTGGKTARMQMLAQHIEKGGVIHAHRTELIAINELTSLDINKIFSDDCLHCIHDVKILLQATQNNIARLMNKIDEQNKNRKWRRRFAVLLIVNLVLWYQIIM